MLDNIRSFLLGKKPYQLILGLLLPMKGKEISELERLSRFVHSCHSHNSQDFKGLTLQLLKSGQSTEAMSALTGVSTSSLYEWIKEWNEKKKLA